MISLKKIKLTFYFNFDAFAEPNFSFIVWDKIFILYLYGIAFVIEVFLFCIFLNNFL